MRLEKKLSGPIEYPSSPLILSNNPDNDNQLPRRAVGWAGSQRRLG
jgi:hypothetical protein